MFNALLLRFQRFNQRLQSFEQSLFRKEIVLPFLLGRLTLIVVMLLAFDLAFADRDGLFSP